MQSCLFRGQNWFRCFSESYSPKSSFCLAINFSFFEESHPLIYLIFSTDCEIRESLLRPWFAGSRCHFFGAWKVSFLPRTPSQKGWSWNGDGRNHPLACLKGASQLTPPQCNAGWNSHGLVLRACDSCPGNRSASFRRQEVGPSSGFPWGSKFHRQTSAVFLFLSLA